MPMTEKQIKQFITEAIPDCSVEIEDLKGDGDHYSAIVKSKSFSDSKWLKSKLGDWFIFNCLLLIR